MNPFEINIDLVHVNVLSPNGNYYYQIDRPVALNPSAFGCRLIMYDRKTKHSLYFNPDVFFHELHTKTQIEQGYKDMLQKQTFGIRPKEHFLEFIWWSLQGNMCYFLEYSNVNSSVKKYESVFINFKNMSCFRIDESIDKYKIIDSLNIKDRQYNEDKIIEKLNQSNCKEEGLINKSNSIKYWASKIGFKKWYP